MGDTWIAPASESLACICRTPRASFSAIIEDLLRRGQAKATQGPVGRPVKHRGLPSGIRYCLLKFGNVEVVYLVEPRVTIGLRVALAR
jgi:hypothetical protein